MKMRTNKYSRIIKKTMTTRLCNHKKMRSMNKEIEKLVLMRKKKMTCFDVINWQYCNEALYDKQKIIFIKVIGNHDLPPPE